MRTRFVLIVFIGSFFSLLFSCDINCFGQDSSSVFHLEVLPGGVLLYKDWKLKVGDNSEWAKYNYDDRDWISFNINESAYQFLTKTKGSVTWLRLHFALDSTLKGNGDESQTCNSFYLNPFCQPFLFSNASIKANRLAVSCSRSKRPEEPPCAPCILQ
jgi:hypothetical protein